MYLIEILNKNHMKLIKLNIYQVIVISHQDQKTFPLLKMLFKQVSNKDLSKAKITLKEDLKLFLFHAFSS